MKVFISWSGERSRRVAELLHTWIECVIQAVEPWVSSSDIDRGALWFTQIIDELATTTHGIICLTRENKEKPWILFEAGALAKGLNSSRIYTLLVDLNPEDIRDPLAQFNHTRPTEGDMFKLVSSINKGLEGKGLKEGVLINAFKTYWPQFQEGLKRIMVETEVDTTPEAPRPQQDVLSEILNSVRGIDKRVRQIEAGGSKQQTSAVTMRNADGTPTKFYGGAPLSLLDIAMQDPSLSTGAWKKIVDIMNDVNKPLPPNASDESSDLVTS